ncbi:hypothetical protein F7725_025804 [Dissostichus mawsoni]|uniref:Complexin 3 n=1 Tax=Dissostichus mawsoni TaxID=36200 RepID=A0A7J5X644_DISMA|nr:hypothetical protein F7725_025804 [Dissostichus mawsoni]
MCERPRSDQVTKLRGSARGLNQARREGGWKGFKGREGRLFSAMAFMVKHVVGGQLKNLTGGLGEEKPEAEKTDAAAQGMTQEEFEQYQQQLEEEKQEREANFAQKKAERATVRSHFRDKYRLPKMIAEDGQEEASKQSVFGHLSNIQNVDMDQLKDKAQATLEDLKKQTENCSLM